MELLPELLVKIASPQPSTNLRVPGAIPTFDLATLDAMGATCKYMHEACAAQRRVLVAAEAAALARACLGWPGSVIPNDTVFVTGRTGPYPGPEGLPVKAMLRIVWAGLGTWSQLTLLACEVGDQTVFGSDNLTVTYHGSVMNAVRVLALHGIKIGVLGAVMSPSPFRVGRDLSARLQQYGAPTRHALVAALPAALRACFNERHGSGLDFWLDKAAVFYASFLRRLGDSAPELVGLFRSLRDEAL